jgi:hypothetical protein
MKWMIPSLFLMLVVRGSGQSIDPVVMLDVNTRPARTRSGDLAGFASLPDARRQLVGIALAVAWESPWLPYLAGGADPEDGGFDCSGAMYFVMRKAGLEPPRSSGAQMEWLAQAAREKAEALTSQQEAARRKRELIRKRARLEQQIAALRSEYETEEAELRRLDEQAGTQTLMLTAERTELARLRQADATVPARTKYNSRPKGET